jgi:hypothetical protein
MHLDITPLPPTSSNSMTAMLKIRAGMGIPAPWRMHHHVLSIHGA